ncbi:hypothetical protein [Flagellimonas meridianipacifica]|nr:hypothetical protein [Allomuricauda pacifica]
MPGEKVVEPEEYEISIGGAQPSADRVKKGSVAVKKLIVSGSKVKI